MKRIENINQVKIDFENPQEYKFFSEKDKEEILRNHHIMPSDEALKKLKYDQEKKVWNFGNELLSTYASRMDKLYEGNNNMPTEKGYIH